MMTFPENHINLHWRGFLNIVKQLDENNFLTLQRNSVNS
jgi:hypothetical protein